MLSLEFQYTVTWTDHLSGAQLHMWLVAIRQHSSELYQDPPRRARQGASSLGTGVGLSNAASKARCVSLVKALCTAWQFWAPASPRSPSSPVTLCCPSLSRVMVCSQRNTSLSQSPRVGFLSSLLPQSKKSPSRVSPAQGPPQAQSAAKKESISSQVSSSLAFLTLGSDI